jgi:Holliday junction resolvase-like predicted endonuclease
MKETDRQMKETDRKIEKTERLAKEAHKKITALGSRIGEIVESMVRGNIVEKFRALNYDITGCSRNRTFKNNALGISGEIDLYLHDGDVAILVEVKTTLETADVRKHIERLEKFRCYVNARNASEERYFIGAVAGAVVTDEAEKFAHENGMYVIVQSGKAVEIVEPPEGFKAKEW